MKRIWEKIADFILSKRPYLLVFLVVFTAFMGYHGRHVELSYDLAKVVPANDPEMLFFRKFTSTFGEDGNILAVGLNDTSIYQLDKFVALQALVKQIKNLEGINDVLSLPSLRYIEKDEAEKRFVFKDVFPAQVQSQAEVDSLLETASQIRFYDGLLYNPANKANMLAVSINREIMLTAARESLVFEVIRICNGFSKATGIELHYGGIPYVRSVMAKSIRQELNMFLAFSLLVTVTVMYLFFRSFSPVIFSVLLIGMVIVCTLGTLGLFGYKITLLTGLLPPILVVIGIPNCVYLLTKYHHEFRLRQNKFEALRIVIKKIGVVTLITNTTTAIGFLVLTMVDITILREFGIVAGINIFFTFFISIIFIPSVFSYLPAPTPRHTQHLDRHRMKRVLRGINHVVNYYRPAVYIVCSLLLLAGIYGMTRIEAVSYIVDDLPDESSIVQDMAFFEDNFKGVMPLEIIIDTGKEQGVRKPENLQKVNELELFLKELPHVSPPVSIVSFLKAANQAYFNGNPASYELPGKREAAFVQRYIKGKGEVSELGNSFLDSTGQLLRISLKVADLGSVRMDSLISHQISPKIDELFADTDLSARITGSTLLFIKGNSYLIDNMKNSLMLAIVIIGCIIGVLFKNIRIMLITIASNLLPLILTAGMMGYFGIPLKPSTALIFSIAFGIAVDDSIHFLAKYRQELKSRNYDILESIRLSIQETGLSMIYTSIVLFGGFIIFVGSDFGGTVALGLLTSATLLVAMTTNLVLLPSLLISFSRGKEDAATDDDDVMNDYDANLDEDENGNGKA